MDVFDIKHQCNKILFLHGFTSGGNCEIAHTLIEALQGEVEVVSPDLPLHPTDALEFVRHLCATEHPDLIVGSSCGAFYAQQVVRTEGIPALLINPFFQMSEFLEPRIGTHAYKCRREDGVQTLDITPELIEEFKQMEQHQFDLYDDFNKDRVWGLFGTQDHLAHFKAKFSEYYSTARTFDGGHTIEPLNVRVVLVPMIKEMLAKVHPLQERYFRHFKGNMYKLWHIALDSETMERKAVYQALYGEHGYWCRPEQMFFEVIERDGKRMPRFKEIVATEIQKCAISDRNNKLLENLLVLWDASVHATHSFLSEEAIESLRPYVLKGLKGVTHLYVTYRGEKPIAFMGIANEKIEMLFVSPYHLRQGLGKQLVELALKNHQAIYVDVNEQNVQAKAFYEHLNYEVYGRTETDDQGNPYPILEMEQKNISFYTERLFIRPLQIKDVEVLHSFMKRIEVMYAWEHGFAQKEVREWINKQIYRYYSDGMGYWGVTLRKDLNVVIGQVGLLKTEIDGKQVIELGYIFNDAYWHHGYAYEAAFQCLHYAFYHLDIDEVYCTVRPMNKSSIRLAEQLGMSKYGSYSKSYRGMDLVHFIYKIKREEFA